MLPLWSHQAEAIDALRAGESASSSRPAPRRASRSATRCRSSTSVVRGDAATPRCSSSRPRRSPRTSCGRCARGSCPGCAPSTYDGDTATDDRAVGPQERERRAHEPRDAAHGDPPVARAVGDVPDAAALRRRRRAAHAARDLRQPRRARAAPPAPACASTTAPIPTFCFASATIGNPAELASTLCGLPVDAIDDDGVAAVRARASRCWQRPLLDEHTGDARVGQRRDRRAARPLRARRPPDARVHAQPRGAELVAAQARAPARATSRPELARRGSPRTAPGYLARGAARARARRSATGRLARRRGHERARARHRRRRARRGRAQRLPRHARVDAAAGGPRRADRPARRGGARRAATTSSTSGTPRIPTELLGRPPEARGREPARTRSCCAPQVACAAHELPLEPDDERWFGAGLDDAVRELVLADQLKPRGGRMYWAGREPPARARRAAHRLVGRVPAASTTTGRALVGTVDDARVFHVAHPGALYLHQGRQYRVERARPRRPRRRCSSRPTTPTSTPRRARRPTSRSSPRTSARRSGRASAHLGAVEVTQPRRRATSASRSSTNEVDRGASPSTSRRATLADPRVLVHGARSRRSSRAGIEPAPGARRGARGRARADRDAAAVHDLRPLGRRRRVDGAAPADRRADDLRLRRLPRRRRHRRARVRRASTAHVRARRSTSSPRARATTAARRACSHRSAATGTSTSTRTRRSSCSARSADGAPMTRCERARGAWEPSTRRRPCARRRRSARRRPGAADHRPSDGTARHR